MKRTGFTAAYCLMMSRKADYQLAKMNALNSSETERELVGAAVRTWLERYEHARTHGGKWEHEYEPLEGEK